MRSDLLILELFKEFVEYGANFNEFDNHFNNICIENTSLVTSADILRTICTVNGSII